MFEEYCWHLLKMLKFLRLLTWFSSAYVSKPWWNMHIWGRLICATLLRNLKSSIHNLIFDLAYPCLKMSELLWHGGVFFFLLRYLLFYYWMLFLQFRDVWQLAMINMVAYSNRIWVQTSLGYSNKLLILIYALLLIAHLHMLPIWSCSLPYYWLFIRALESSKFFFLHILAQLLDHPVLFLLRI